MTAGTGACSGYGISKPWPAPMSFPQFGRW